MSPDVADGDREALSVLDGELIKEGEDEVRVALSLGERRLSWVFQPIVVDEPKTESGPG